MKLSIITATYNSSLTIRDCINSVTAQTYPDIEQIIIDGASTDNTVAIIKSTPNRVKNIISEPDCGIYDAMNKGLLIAHGEVIGILNSDDLYFDSSTIDMVMNLFMQTNVDCVYGDLYYVDKDNTDKIVRNWKTDEFTSGAFYKGWHPAHPSIFLRRKVYELYGNFDLSFKIAADFEFMLRVMERYNISSIYLPKPLVRMRLGGKSNKSFKNIYLQNIECFKAFKKNGLNVSLLYPLYRLIPKLKQFYI